MKHAVYTCTACTLLAMSGCVSSNLGERVGDETLQQFQAGVTTEAWLVAILGEPSSMAPVRGVENTQVYRYSLTQQRGGFMAMIYGDDRRTVSVVYFIITDGVVTRFWADRETDHTALGIPIETTGGVKE